MKQENMHVNLMICTPGHSMMADYVKSLIAWAVVAAQNNISWSLSTGYSSHVADAREVVLSGTRKNSLTQNKPFEGNITYDKLLWIDSDIEFLPEDILKLYKSDKEIVSGAYLLASGEVVAYKTIKEGSLSIDEVERMRDLIEIEGAGFGFICIKQGVFEVLSRPWFQSAITTVKLEDDSEYTFAMIGEDLSWCQRVREKGYTIWLDPAVKVNHHKTMKLTWKGITNNE